MEEIKVNALNEEALNEVSGGKHFGRVTGKTTYKNVYCHIYCVGSGDCLSWIAQDFGFGSNYMYLAKFNNLTNPNKIYVNQILYIPVR